MMSNAMTAERRRKQRISAQKGAIAFSDRRYGQIIDASLDGLCFQYYTSTSKTTDRNVQEERPKENWILFSALSIFFLSAFR